MLSWFEKHSKISWLITLIIAITIFYISSLNFEPSPKTGFPLKSILYHILAFFGFTFFLAISLTKGKYKILIIPTILISIIYGISDEIHQHFVPGRHASFSDVFHDTTGIIFASMIYLITILYRKNHPDFFTKNK